MVEAKQSSFTHYRVVLLTKKYGPNKVHLKIFHLLKPKMD